MKRQGESALWTGERIFWDDEWDYSFFHERTWFEYDFEDGRPGVILSPDESNPVNLFSVQPSDLGMEVTEDDLPVLAEGFLSGLQKLPGCKIESQEEVASRFFIRLEAVYTFEENGERRKRWCRLIYQGTRRYLLIAQGASPEDYQYWYHGFYTCMTTFWTAGPRVDWPGGPWPPPGVKQRAEERRKRREEAAKQRSKQASGTQK